MEKRLLAMLLALALCVGTVSAHTHPGTDDDREIACSDWAADEIEAAAPLRLIPGLARQWPTGGLPTDYREPIRRTEFRQMAMQFVAHWNGCDCETLGDLVEFYRAEKDENGRKIEPFTDGYLGDAEAYYLGVVQGRGNGIFDPEGLITRQEAALMLLRAYRVCVPDAGTVPDAPDFSDWADVDEWARDAVATVAAWGVMNGMGDGTFAPKGTYSIEQCILTFRRLWIKLAVDVGPCPSPMFTYEQCMDYFANLDKQSREGNAGHFIGATAEGPKATFVQIRGGGYMMAQADCYFVYPDGGMKLLDLGLCSYRATGRLSGSTPITECRFSEDGNTFTCVVEQTYSMQGEHEKGLYQVTIDVDSLAYAAEYMGPLETAE